MSAGTIWMVLGLFICGGELLHPGVYLLWIGLAACGTGLLSLALNLDFNTQIISFIGLVVFILALPLFFRRMFPPVAGAINSPDGGLIGTTCRAGHFADFDGRVHVADGTWLARCVDGHSPPEGALLQIIGLERKPSSLNHRGFPDAGEM